MTKRSSTNGSSSSSENTASPPQPSRRKKAWGVLITIFALTNTLSAITGSVFHVYFKPDNNNDASSSIMSTILQENFSRVTTAVTSTSTSTASSEITATNTSPLPPPDNKDKKETATTAAAISQESTTSFYYPLLKPLNSSSQQLLYKRLEDYFNTHKGLKLTPQQNLGTCTHRNIVHENMNQSTIEYVACCGLGHRLGRMSSAALVARKMKAHLYGYWSCCDEVEVFSHLFGNEPIILHDESEESDDNQEDNNDANTSGSNTTTTPWPIHLQFRNEVAGFGSQSNKCKATDEKIQSDFAFYSTLRERYTNKHVVDKFVQQHFTNETLSIAIHIRAGNGETGDFARKKRQIDDPEVFVRNTANMIREIVAQNVMSSYSQQQQQQLSPLVFIATDTPSYVDAFRKELAENNIPVVTLPAQVHVAEGEGVMFGVFNKVTQSGEKCLDGWRNVVEDMLVMSHADVVFAPSYSSFTQTIPISLTLGRNKDAHGENKSHITAPFCDVTAGKLSCYETFRQWHCMPHGQAKSVTHQDIQKSWLDVLLPES